VYIAHISEDGRVQTCTDHSRNTAKLAEKTLSSMGLGSAAYLAGLLHDCGKFTEEFTIYIQKAVKGEGRRGSVIHSFAGGSYLLEKYHSEKIDYKALAAEWLACAVYNHHGLIDLVDEVGENGYEHRKTKQPDYDRRAQEAFLENCAGSDEIDELFQQSAEELQKMMERFLKIARNNEESLFYAGLLSRLLTSAVIEGDRTDTANFMNGQNDHQTSQDMKLVWECCIQSLNRKLESFPPTGRLQEARRVFSEKCLAFADCTTGIYRLDLPTGSGKTMSSLRFAIEHAKRTGKKRVIYVAPLLSILEQNAAVIREAVDHEDWILEHHSNVTAENSGVNETELNPTELLQENWDIPIVITTQVRVLETMFSHRMTDVRRFHALCESVIILDEVQSIPSRMLSLFNLAMNFLSVCCKSTIVLCSATQPPFDQACRKMLLSKDQIVGSRVLEKYAPLFKRTDIQYDGHYTTEELPEYVFNLFQHSQNILIVCNTKSEAAELFVRIRDKIPLLFYLSAGMCMAHRKKVLKNLRKALTEGKRLACVSTQVIEAGIDISFETVVRLSAGLDNVVQCAGRCNRDGESESLRPVRIVRHTDQKLGNLTDIQDAQNALNDLITQFNIEPDRFKGDLSSKEAVDYYYGSLYRAMKTGAQDYSTEQGTLFSMLSENGAFAELCKVRDRYAMHQAFKTAAHLFCVFDKDTQSILIPYDKGAELIRELESEKAKYDLAYCRRIAAQAKGYDVTVAGPQLKRLLETGTVFPICNGMFYAAESYCYDEDIGLLEVKKIKEELEECSILI